MNTLESYEKNNWKVFHLVNHTQALMLVIL